MANGWTPERRARQAQLIQQWQPWNRSTGPRSEQGKAAASRNAMKHGMRSAAWEAERRALNKALQRLEECRSDLPAFDWNLRGEVR